MGLNHIIALERSASVGVDLTRLKISFGEAVHFFAPLDVATLILAHPAITITHGAMRALAGAGAVLLSCDDKHIPCAMQIPTAFNQQIPRRIFLQSKHHQTHHAGTLWQRVVQSKILGQSENLAYFDLPQAKALLQLSDLVQPFDQGKVEAQASRIYWKALLGHGFYRSGMGAEDAINGALNYGFSIVRSSMARAVFAYGLNPAFGIGHHRMDNPFNLVDDLMEPFRFLVEREVRKMDIDPDAPLDRASRQNLIAIMESSLSINGKTYRVHSGMDLVVQSFAASLENTAKGLILPFMKRAGRQANPRFWSGA